MTTAGGSSDPSQAKPEMSAAAMQAIHDAMMEELGVGRRAALPLADRGPTVGLTPIARPRSSTANAWSTAVFDDVDPAGQLESIADGQLYRMRRGGLQSQQQSSRGGGPWGTHTVGTYRYDPIPSRGGGFGPHGGRGGRGNIGKRHQDAIAMLRNTPSTVPLSSKGRATTRGDRGGMRGGGRGRRGGSSSQGSSRQRRPVPELTVEEAAYRRSLQPTNAGRLTGLNAQGSSVSKAGASTHCKQPTPRVVPVPIASGITSEPAKSRQLSKTIPQPTSNVKPLPQAAVAQGDAVTTIVRESGVRVRLHEPDSASSPAMYRVLGKGGLIRLQVKKISDTSPCIDDVMASTTTLFTNRGYPTIITYCAHRVDEEMAVWDMIFSVPHEAEKLEGILMPNGPQDHIDAALRAQEQRRVETLAVEADATLPETNLLDSASGTPTDAVAEANHDLLGLNVAEEPQRSAMLELGFLGMELMDEIFDVINANASGSFLDRLQARSSEVNERSTVADILASTNALLVAKDIVRDFFSNSALFTWFTLAEETEYVEMLTPGLLASAITQRDATKVAMPALETEKHVPAMSEVDLLASCFGQVQVGDSSQLFELPPQPVLVAQVKGVSSEISSFYLSEQSMLLSRQTSQLDLPKMTSGVESVKSESIIPLHSGPSSSFGDVEARSVGGKEDRPASELAEVEERKQRGIAALAGSKWAQSPPRQENERYNPNTRAFEPIVGSYAKRHGHGGYAHSGSASRGSSVANSSRAPLSVRDDSNDQNSYQGRRR